MSKKHLAGLLMTAHIYFAQYGLLLQFITGVMFVYGLDLAFEAKQSRRVGKAE